MAGWWTSWLVDLRLIGGMAGWLVDWLGDCLVA